MEALVVALADDLGPVFSRVPYLFLGYSMGAWIAYALSQELRRREYLLPQRLFVAARRAPHLPEVPPLFSTLPDDQMVIAIQERYNAIPQALREDPNSLAVFLPGLRADLQILDTYQWPQDPPLPIPIHVFYGTEDLLTPVAEMRAWQDHTTHQFSFHGLPGGHFFLRESRLDLIKIILSLLP